jgi:hypothetical protein
MKIYDKYKEKELSISSIVDKSNYLRGLLIFILKDKNVWDHEMSLFLDEGKSLGFNKEFCEDSINNLILNSYIDIEPPVFFDKAVAKKLINKGIQIISDDKKVHPDKLAFLEAVAKKNGLTKEYKMNLLRRFKNIIS